MLKIYRGFESRYFYCLRTHLYIGEVINTQDCISYSAVDEASLAEAFVDSVEAYLSLYQQLYPEGLIQTYIKQEAS